MVILVFVLLSFKNIRYSTFEDVIFESGMVVYTVNLSARETETGGSL